MMLKRIGAALAATVAALAVLAVGAPAQATFNGAGYYYATVSQTLTGTDHADGLSANVYVVQPYVPTTIYGGIYDHSLIALAVARTTSGAAGDAIEVGVAVERNVWGDNKPHLYSCAWHNGSAVTGCYTGSGGPWVDDTGNATNLGTDLTGDIGTAKQIQVYESTLDCGLSANGWHVYYNGSHVGCWQPTAFTAGWANAQYLFSFGEYLYNGYNNPGTANDRPCGDMSDGFLQGSPPTTGHPYVGSLTLVNSTGPASSFSLGTVTDSNAYNLVFATGSTRTYYYGGAGYKFVSGVATTPGNAGSC